MRIMESLLLTAKSQINCFLETFAYLGCRFFSRERYFFIHIFCAA